MTPTTFKNPLEESTSSYHIADPCVLTIFGATGDLTKRKLMPALYNLAREGQLPAHFCCVAFARRDKTHEEFRQEMKEAVSQFSRVTPLDEELWEHFASTLFYHKACFTEDEGYQELDVFLKELDAQYDTAGNRVYYLSTQPSYFPDIVERLSTNGLIYDTADEATHYSRIIIEKPFGRDLESAQKLQTHVTRFLSEKQIYRIDHYLGKETVQNILNFRFTNPLFESLWNNKYVDHVQITAGEDLGIGTRGNFYEEAGLLRDIVQNHVMQLLSLVAMEPPVNLTADSIRDEKVKVVESIRPIDLQNFSKYCVRGQYAHGYINGEDVVAYRQEHDVNPTSSMETYVALQLYVDNWRWAGVPFYLRAGKRLPKRATEVAITFKGVPGILFQADGQCVDGNTLVIRIQPDEGISLKVNCKVPGLGNLTQPVKMDFRYGSYFGQTPPEAYERLICDCMHGDGTLFARGDEVVASWRLLTPVLERWNESDPGNFPNYEAGTWGPNEAEELLATGGRSWRLL